MSTSLKGKRVRS